MKGQLSSPAVFTVGPRLRGSSHLPFALRWHTQMSLPPKPPGTLLLKYKSLLSGESDGDDSQNSEFTFGPRFSGSLHPCFVRYDMYRSQLPSPCGKLQPVKISHCPSCEIFCAPRCIAKN